MPCFKPLTAYQGANGDVVFVERKRYDIVRELQLPCGQCIGCRLERSRQWAMRCMHEAKCHDKNAFVTLTYSDEHLPENGSLRYDDYQRFMKRVRKAFEPSTIRFFMCGEYGDNLGRPHYHACLFGIDFEDKKYWRTTESGSKSYRSELLERLWPAGASEIGDVNFESAGYIARYCVKKVTGDMAEHWYGDKVPEFCQASRRPGLGRPFLEKFGSDIYPHDHVIVRGKEVKPPKYYDKIFKKESPDVFEDLQARREAKGRSNWKDNTPERLAVKEIVQKAQARQLKRNSI